MVPWGQFRYRMTSVLILRICVAIWFFTILSNKTSCVVPRVQYFARGRDKTGKGKSEVFCLSHLHHHQHRKEDQQQQHPKKKAQNYHSIRSCSNTGFQNCVWTVMLSFGMQTTKIYDLIHQNVNVVKKWSNCTINNRLSMICVPFLSTFQVFELKSVDRAKIARSVVYVEV